MFEKLFGRKNLVKNDLWTIMILKQEDDSGITFRLHKAETYYGTIFDCDKRVTRFNRAYSNQGFVAVLYKKEFMNNTDPNFEYELRP